MGECPTKSQDHGSIKATGCPVSCRGFTDIWDTKRLTMKVHRYGYIYIYIYIAKHHKPSIVGMTPGHQEWQAGKSPNKIGI